MKNRNTGIEFVNQSLGVLYDGLSMMFSADSTTANDAQKLGSLIALNILKEGGGCILIYENLPFSMAVNETLYFHSPENKLTLEKAINEGRLHYLNIVVQDTISTLHSNHSKFIKNVKNNPNRIMCEILNSKNQIKKGFSDIPILVLQTGISALVVDFGPKAALNMVRKVILNVKSGRNFFLGILNREMQERHVTNSFTHLADYVLEFGMDIISGKRQTYVSVNRTPQFKDTGKKLKKFVCELSEDNFYTIPSLPSSFKELKENIFYLERGEITAYDTNYIITGMIDFVHLLKEIEKKLGKDEYIKTIKRVGKEMGSHIAKALSSQFHPTTEELFKAALNQLSITGWGKFNILEGDIKSKRIIVEGFSIFASNYGKSNYPVCVMEESILQGILEELTALNWTCIEKECVAKGDKKCEFELKPVEND